MDLKLSTALLPVAISAAVCGLAGVYSEPYLHIGGNFVQNL